MERFIAAVIYGTVGGYMLWIALLVVAVIRDEMAVRKTHTHRR